MIRPLMSTLSLGLMVLTTACVGSGSNSSGNSGVGGPGGESGQPNFRVVDLENGFAGNLDSIDDLETNKDYKDTLLVFKWVPSGRTQLGTRDAVLGEAGADEDRSEEAVSGFYMTVWEVTQAQWELLAKQNPWRDVDHPGAVEGTGTKRRNPAFNISHEEAQLALAAFDGERMRLPTNKQWEYAARAGSTGLFHWGDRLDAATADKYAVVHSTEHGRGVAEVGSKSANAFGLFDMAGNVYEVTREGDLRGGAWSSNLIQARCANKVAGEELVENGVVGVRLVIE